jgi:hypothetical protein
MAPALIRKWHPWSHSPSRCFYHSKSGQRNASFTFSHTTRSTSRNPLVHHISSTCNRFAQRLDGVCMSKPHGAKYKSKQQAHESTNYAKKQITSLTDPTSTANGTHEDNDGEEATASLSPADLGQLRKLYAVCPWGKLC